MSEGQPPTRRPGPLDPGVLALLGSLRRHLVVASIAAVGVAAAVLAQAELLATVIPQLVDGDSSGVTTAIAGLGAVAIVRAVAAGTTDRSATVAVASTRRSIRQAVLDHVWVEDLRSDHREELVPAGVASLVTSASDAVEPWIRSYAPGLPLAVVVPLAAGLRIAGADLTSALILAVVVPLVPIFMVLVGMATERRTATQWEALGRLSARFLDVIAGLPTLRLFGRADAQVARVREVTDRYRSVTMSTLRVAFLSALVLELLAALSVALVAVALGGRLVHGQLDLETALVVLLLAPECLLPIRRVAAAFHAAASGVDAAAEVHRALDLPRRPAGETSWPATGGELVATGVTVTDPRRGARLAAVDLRAAPGQVVAVTGPSGAGKSTLLEVLRGAIAPDHGAVTIGGTPIAEVAPGARARALRWVPQRAQPLGATIETSVALGHGTGADVDRAVGAALERFDLTSIATLAPADASGGERRRIALARAWVGVELGTVAVWLVDEPTAQLDDQRAAAVIDAVAEARRRGVGVAATHDDRLVAMADTVVALAAAPAPAPDGGPEQPNLDAASTAPPRPAQAPVPDPVPGWAAQTDLDPGDAGRGALGWLAGTARAERGRLVGAWALGIATDACAVALTATAAWLIVRAAEQPSFADLAVAAVGVRAFALGKGVLRYAERLGSHDATLRLLADLRATVIARLARLAPTGLPPHGRGDLLSRLVEDIDRMQDLFLRVVGPVASALVVGVAASLAVATIDPLGGVTLAVLVVAVGVVLPATAHRVARARGRAAAGLRGAIAADAVELAEHAEELLAADATGTWRQRLAASADRLDAVERRQGLASASIAAAVAAAPGLAVAAMVAAVGLAVTGPAAGVLVLLPLAVAELVAPLAGAGEALARVEASTARVLTLLRQPDPVVEPAVPAPPPDRADVSLTGVAARWPGGPLQVEGVDLALPEGARAVITGPSGSGKSTLAAVLVAFLAPTEGSYALGGTATADLGGDVVRRIVTWCQQDPWFASSTLADNLRIAAPAATDDEVWDALTLVQLDEWARRLPEGLDTPLARDAADVSGGQRQRLALARALLGGQRVLVLDEPTAHLDEQTATDVMGDLLAATAGRSVIVITHDAEGRALGPTWELVATADGPSRWRRRT